jgi:hypothetical protein
MRDPALAVSLMVLGLMVSLVVTQRLLQGRLARVERKLNALLGHFNIDPAPGTTLSDRVRELARDPSGQARAPSGERTTVTLIKVILSL